MSQRIELLSPAKDLDTGIAAINYGADAVYIGGPKFGARAAAGNSLLNIEKLVKHSHNYWAKVYVALNTVIFDFEIEEVRKLITKIYEMGVDAIIIQDMGILKMDLPPIPIFASTQTHNYEMQKIKFLEAAGIRRVILARELNLNQIQEIKNNSSIELEFFIHGALCVCFSGQCYLSYATTGRSANRGECSQPCRLPYTLVDSNGKEIIRNKHLLSIKDLNLSDSILQLMKAGITSFKIEGRLKDINYVKNITAFYRQRLDELISGNNQFKRSSSGFHNFYFSPDPEKTFNRGYTKYFIKETDSSLGAINTPKSIGKLLGKVKLRQNEYFIIDSNEKISNGDGLCYFTSEGTLYGFGVSKTDGQKIFIDNSIQIEVGTPIYRNHDHQFIKTLTRDKSNRKIACNIMIDYHNNSLKLNIIDEDEISVSITKSYSPIESGRSVTPIQKMKQQLSKAGDTIFHINNIVFTSTVPIDIKVSEINKLRRDILQLLQAERQRLYQNIVESKTGKDIQFPYTELNYLGNVTNNLSRAFYHEHGVKKIEDGFELMSNYKNTTVLTSKYCIKKELNICPLVKSKAKLPQIAEPLFLKTKEGKLRLEFNCCKCEMSIIYV
jgi:putative protease